MNDPTRTPDHYAEALASWRTDRPLPGAVERLTLQLQSLRALSGVRRQVRKFLVASLGAGRVVDVTECFEDVVERAIFVVDELTSNALRHGAPPCGLHIGEKDSHWIVIVTDGAPDQPPTPARERPAGQGGYGLYLVADLTAAYGVHYETDRKMVWARIAMTA